MDAAECTSGTQENPLGDFQTAHEDIIIITHQTKKHFFV